MRVTFQERNRYIPKWNGNRKELESEQVVIIWKYPNAEEVKDIRRNSNPKVSMRGGKIDKDSVEIEIKVDELLAVKKLVVDIEKLNVNGKDIKDGADLILEPGLNELVQEISAVIMMEMDKVRANSKNS